MNAQNQQIVETTQAAHEVWPVVVATPLDMLNRAVTQGADPVILERLMALYERWEVKQACRAFDEALAAAKAKIPTIVKNRHVGFESRKPGAAKTDYRHEDLAEIARTIDPILGAHGITYRWRTTSEINQPITVTCILSHRAGHREENTLIGPRDDSGNKNSIQAIGSTVTYLQRYTLKAALGLAASNDDDGAKSEPDECIESDQFAVIKKLMVEARTDEVKFLKLFKIDAIADLPTSKFQKAVDELNAAIAWQKQAKK